MVDSRSDGTSTATDTTELESPADHSRETVIPLFRKSFPSPGGSFQPAAYRFPGSRIVTNSWLTSY